MNTPWKNDGLSARARRPVSKNCLFGVLNPDLGILLQLVKTLLHDGHSTKVNVMARE